MNEYMTVSVSSVGVDMSYQRGLKPHHRRIAREFDPQSAGTPVVNVRPDGTMWAVDGQQRFAAMKILGITQWQVQIVRLKTVEEEAALFVRLNGGDRTKTNVGEKDRYKARLRAGDPVTVAAKAAVERAGLRLNVSHNNDWPCIRATGLCVNVCRIHGPELLERACRVIAGAWPHDPDALSNGIIEGVTQVLVKCPGVDDARLTRQMSQVPVLRLIQRARLVGAGNRLGVIQELIIEQYNKRLLTKNRLTITLNNNTPKPTTPEETPEEGDDAGAV